MKLLWTDLRLAWRNVLRHRRRSAVAIASVAFGITALLLAGGFVEYNYWGMREGIIQSQLGHIQIARPGYQDGGRADPYTYLLPDAAPATVGAAPHVLAVAPRLSFGGLASHGDATISFVADGVDPAREAAFGSRFEISAGRGLSAAEPLGIVMGEGLARNLGVVPGDSIVLLATTARGSTNAVEVGLRGLFVTATKGYDDSALRLPLATAQRLLRASGAHLWLVLLDDTANTAATLAILRASLPSREFELAPWYDLADYYNKTKELFGRQVDGVKLIIALIIVLSITNTMMMSVMERTGEIGTALALGVRRAGILRLFLGEGLLLGLLGALLGLVVAGALAAIISAIGIPMPAPPGLSHGYLAKILLTWSSAGEAVALAVLTALAASAYPAWGASRRNIVDALRHNR